MLNKKTIFLVLLIAVLISYELTIIYIPDNLERPFTFKIKYLTLKTAGVTAKLASYFNIGSHAYNIRSLLKFVTSMSKSFDSDIIIEETKLNNIPVRVYTPKNSKTIDKPIMLFFHGGGYCLGDLDTYDKYLIELSKKVNMVTISVDYRLSPEFPHPIPTEDCYSVVNYVIKNYEQFGVDLEKMIISGDSAGGNAAAVITQKLKNQNLKYPKIQVLVYPWLQMFTFHLPSMMRYATSGLIKATQIDLVDFVAWYLGITEISDEMEKNLLANNHTLLLSDDNKKNLIKSYLDVGLIPDEYKIGKNYYNNYTFLFPNYELDDSSILLTNSSFVNFIEKTLDPQVSPLFADHEKLVGLPKTYFLLTEWDSLKDEGILYSERLKRAGVDVKVKFYEQGFHGIASFVDHNLGYELAKGMLDDLVDYIRDNI